jgi:RNA polymerase sigma factor (sigma-70 family)
MRTRSIQSVFRQAERYAADGRESPTPDADLYRSFVQDGNESSFAALVHRHGPMVWGVCRNQLGEADAEDAFQATFLALVRAGATIRNPAAVGGWLLRVAVQVCRRVRLTAGRRRIWEGRAAVSEAARPEPDAEWHDLHAAVHAEIDRLPDHLRSLFVLCCLEGVRPTDAAARLGMKVGTVTSLVSRARARLLGALRSRDLVPGITVGMAAFSTSIGTAVPPTALAAVLAFPRVDATAGVSSSVLTLARSVTEVSMIRWKTLAAVLMFGTALTAGVGGRYFAGASAQPPASANNKPANLSDPSAPGVTWRDAKPGEGYNAPAAPLSAPPGLTTSTIGARPVWEYEVVILRPDARGELNALGKDGWELVSVDRATNGIATAYLKRPAASATTASTAGSSSGTITSAATGNFMLPGSRSSTSGSTRGPTPGTSTAGTPILPGTTIENYGIVRLQRLSATAAAAVLRELYRGKAGFDSVTVDEESNSLVIRGSVPMVKRAKATIEKLDDEKEEPGANRQ